MVQSVAAGQGLRPNCGKNMSQRTWVCTVCTIRTAETFCCCGTSETFLSAQCLPAHFMKLPGRLHFNLPIGYYGEHKKPGFLERLQTRMVELPGRTEILRQNLGKVEECRALFGAKVEELIAKIRAEAQTIQEELATLREKLERDISTAVQEVEATMHADEALHISPLGQLLRDTSVPAQQLCHFDYQAAAFVWPLRSCFSF